MKIALVLGVSEYKNISSLPGCKNDYLAMLTLLTETEEFDDIVSIFDEDDSISFKEKLTLFFKKYKGKKVDELFFYYTGHGDFYQEEFYYILPDFKESSLKQTAIQNNEIDNLMRSLNPGLVIKVIDACKSGVSYVKDRNAVGEFIQKSGEKFMNCYFLHSSLSSQFSYQNDRISHFTQSFLSAIAEYKGNKIRYKHIIDYISDFFGEVEEQTPYFVLQAELTEEFCDITPKIRSTISKYLDTHTAKEEEEKIIAEPLSEESEPKTLLEKVINTSNFYRSEEEVGRLMLDIKDSFETFNVLDELREIYKLEKKFPTYISSRAGIDKIGKELWNVIVEGYFFTLQYEEETYEEEARSGMLSVMQGFPARTITKTRSVISGYELTAKYPYDQIIIEIESDYRPLSDFHYRLCFVTSEKEIRFFSSIVEYQKMSFNEKKVGGFVEWESKKFLLADEENICLYIIGVLEGINSFLLDYIKSKVE